MMALFPTMFSLLSRSFEHVALCMAILESYILLDCPAFPICAPPFTNFLPNLSLRYLYLMCFFFFVIQCYCSGLDFLKVYSQAVISLMERLVGDVNEDCLLHLLRPIEFLVVEIGRAHV